LQKKLWIDLLLRQVLESIGFLQQLFPNRMIVKIFQRRAFPFAGVLLMLLITPGCNVLKDRVAELGPVISNGLETGLTNGLHKAKLDSLVAAAADSLWKNTRRHLDTTLVELPGPVYHFADSLLGQIVLRHTVALTDTLNAGLSKIKNNLTDEQLADYVTRFVQERLGPVLQKLVLDLGSTINSPDMRRDLGVFRLALQLELDSLLRSGLQSLGTGIDSSLMSRIDTVLAHIEHSGKKTTRSVSGILWVIGGIVAFLALLFFAIRTHLTKLKYRKMAEIITLEINRIGPRTVYDQVVGNIRPRMQEAGLEQLLREEILRKQGLIAQPEWETDEDKLLHLLKEKLTQPNQEEFFTKMKELGLNIHQSSN